MKVVILAGGLGTRISEESFYKPKPLVEVGEKPMLWHIMKIYSYYGYNDFIICCGYKGYMIKEYFAQYFLHQADVTFDFTNRNGGQQIIHDHSTEPWKVTLINTGLNTMTGGRVKRIQRYIGNDPFMLTYGDGVADVNINRLVDFHFSHGKLATVTAVQPRGRFGALDLGEKEIVEGFIEKPVGDGGWINGGFFVMQPQVFEHIEGDHTVLEREPLEQMSRDKQLVAYKHPGFWQPMDTLRDKNLLESMWKSGGARWKLWD
ncbi:MAG TPA: glucose-1-phosphate cytidylyltransferase [Spirochaetia bacterium]|nr:glucose-1-phosphate cytidylyltransferase [Spirochaetia bacterium]